MKATWGRRQQEGSFEAREQEMDIREVVLGAAFGAAVAVNAALQSLQDAGSFLVCKPSAIQESSMRASRLSSTNDRRAVEKLALNMLMEDDPYMYAAEEALNEEDEEDEDEVTCGAALDSSSGLTEALALYKQDIGNGNADVQFLCNSRTGEGGGVKRTFEESCLNNLDANCYLAKDESVEVNKEEQMTSADEVFSKKKRGSIQIPTFLPGLSDSAKSEEAMAAMLERTTNTVLETLFDAQERRQCMIQELREFRVPENETSLALVSGFIDALVNVSDSLKKVHSALFISKESSPLRIPSGI